MKQPSAMKYAQKKAMIALRANDDDFVSDDTLARSDDSTSSKRNTSDTHKLQDER